MGIKDVILSIEHKPERPGWLGMMQMMHKGQHPGKASVLLLPMIDMNPSDMTCINSTLTFVCEQAKQYNITPVITFDQPLFWKALTIITSETNGSPHRDIVLKLGGFHVQMSFLGSIGHLMAGSGLAELLEIMYAPNAVGHMLSGKAVNRALRGHFLLDTALNTLLVSMAVKKPFPVHEEEKVDDEFAAFGWPAQGRYPNLSKFSQAYVDFNRIRICQGRQ